MMNFLEAIFNLIVLLGNIVIRFLEIAWVMAWFVIVMFLLIPLVYAVSTYWTH